MIRIRAFVGLLSGLAAISLGGAGAYGSASPWAETEHGAVRLIAGADAVGASESLSLGLQFRLKKGWKVYWRSPGDAGFPPQPDWSGSSNVGDVSVAWPRPVRFDVQGLTTLGYKDEVVLPVSAAALRPGEPVTVRATVPYLTCNEICVPYEAKLALSLPAGPERSTREAGLIAHYAALVPPKGPTGSLAVTGARVDGPAGRQTLRVTARLPQGASPDLLIEGPDGYRFSSPKVEQGGAGTVFLAAVSPPPSLKKDEAPADLAGSSLTLTLLTDDAAVEQTVKAETGRATLPPPPPAPLSLAAFLGILGLAVLGGLILNLMPCVLPVLSLKVLSVIGHGGAAEKRPVRMGFLASAAGIVASFLVLASVAVALKAAGQAAGWGIQFQQPVFLTVMAVIVALFAANLWGLFEIRLPGRMADHAAAAGGHGHGMMGHFATGAFAALLATPCSAPFVGTAVGFALSRGAVEIFAIFIALGIGLAIPYLLIAAVPTIATRLPRPGPWMVTLKRILSLALLATAVWLLTVLATQIGMPAALTAGCILAAILFLLWLAPRLRHVPGPLIGGTAAALALAAILVPPQLARETASGTVLASQPYWKPFSPEAVAAHVAAGKTVFVDVTADWCVTCKVNKALVLDTDDIAARLESDDVIAMRADWTRPDPVITAFLERFGRYGIPFNVAFGPGAPDGVPLPELLTRDAVFAALDTASSPSPVAGR